MQVYKEIKILNTRPSKKLVKKLNIIYMAFQCKKNFSVGQLAKISIKKIEI